MDIIQARKKARELEEKKKSGKRKPTASKPGRRGSGKKKAGQKEHPSKKTSAKKKAPVKKEPAEKTPLAKPEEQKEKSSGPQEIFMDFSFGEDLPAHELEPKQVHLDVKEVEALEPETEKPAFAHPPEIEKTGDEPGLKPEMKETLPRGKPEQPAEKSEFPQKDQPKEKGLEEEEKEEDRDFIKLVEEDLFRQGFGEEAIKDTGPQIQLLSFQLGKENYAVPLTCIQQIIKMREVTMVPRAPEYIAGVLSLRGMVLPVFDLRKRLGLEAQPYTRDTRIIVVMVDSRHCGLIVDRVKQVVRIPEDSLEEPPAILGRVAEGPGGEAEFLEGIGRFDHQMLIILNLVKVLEISHQAQAVGNKIPEKGRLT